MHYNTKWLFSAGYIRNAIIWSTPENRARSYWSNIFTFGGAISCNKCKIKLYLKTINIFLSRGKRCKHCSVNLAGNQEKLIKTYNFIESVSIDLQKVLIACFCYFLKVKHRIGCLQPNDLADGSCRRAEEILDGLEIEEAEKTSSGVAIFFAWCIVTLAAKSVWTKDII